MNGMEVRPSVDGTPGPAPPRPPKVTLFEDLVVSNPPKRRQGLFVPGSVVGHVVALAALVLVPILWPENPPIAPDSVGVLVFNPPPAIALSLNKGSSLVEKKAETKKTTPDPQAKKPDFVAPTTQRPVEQELQPEQAEPESEVAGSETGTEHGSPEGMEGGSDTGQIGGILGGTEGGCVGCWGNGAVLDYDEQPKLIRNTKPQYPQEAFVKKIEGVVTVEFVIDEQGQVASVRIIKSIPMLDAAAMACIKQWIFSPAKKGGRPVRTIAQAPVAFRIF